jgi:hypothetical protein
MVKGYEIPATMLRRGLGRVVERSMHRAFPGSGMHAVPRDFSQYNENRIIFGLTHVRVLTTSASVFGSGITGA